jgi:hypothetical protein
VVRRDVLRIGIGRFLFEGALGVVLLSPADDETRVLAMALALAGAIVAHLTQKKRRAFVAAHLALATAAISVHATVPIAPITLAIGLGAAIELSHIDLVERRRLTEHVRSLRIPSSLIARRLGSAVVVAAVGRALLPVSAMVLRPTMLAPLMVAMGAFAMLSAGRSVTRPIDAVMFVLLAAAVVIPT